MRSTSGPIDGGLTGETPLERTPDVSALVLNAPPRRRPWLRMAALLGAVLVALYFAGHWLLYDRHRVYTDDAMIDTDQVYVTTRVAERVARILVDENQHVRRGQAVAVLDDATERAAVDLAEHNLRSLRAAAVAAGDAAALERELQIAQVQEQAGGVEAARKSTTVSESQAAAATHGLAVAEAQLASAHSQLVSAQSAIPAAGEALRKAESDLRRNQSLARQGYVAESAVESAVSAVAQARAAHTAAVAQADAAGAGVRTAEATLAQQRANSVAAAGGASASAAQIPIAQARTDAVAAPSRVANKRNAAFAAESQANAMAAQLRMAELALRDTKILAPVDGWISARNAAEGQMLTPGQAVVTISPANRIYVTANYKETQIHRIRPGMPVDISIDACGGAKVRGTVIGFAPVAQNALSTLPTLSAPTNFVKVTQRVPIRIALPKNAGSCVFRPGTAVETSIVAD